MDKRAFAPMTMSITLIVISIVVGVIAMSIGKDYLNKEPIGAVTAEPVILISSEDVSGDHLKELQFRYITGKITLTEYLEQERKIIVNLTDGDDL